MDQIAAGKDRGACRRLYHALTWAGIAGLFLWLAGGGLLLSQILLLEPPLHIAQPYVLVRHHCLIAVPKMSAFSRLL
jgi:hypothetical protein